MTPLETVKAAIAETPDESGLSANDWALRDILSVWYHETFSLSEVDADLTANRLITEAARRAVDAMPEVDRLTRDLAEARAERDAARAVLRQVEWEDNDCPYCHGSPKHGHTPPDCVLAAAIEPATPPVTPIASGQAGEREAQLCSDCPPVGYPTDETRCEPCPRRDRTLRDTGSAP